MTTTSPYFQKIAALAYPAPTHVLPAAVTYAEFTHGLSVLQPGQTLPSHGVAFPKETTISKSLAGPAPARLYFDKNCKFPGGAGPKLPALYITKSDHVQYVFDPLCLITNPYGAGIRVEEFSYGVIDGFHVRGVGTDGVECFPTRGDIHHGIIRGEVSSVSLDKTLDPHAEDGTGFHCANLADAAPDVFHDMKVAIHGHDSLLGGSVIEYGNPAQSNAPHDVELYVLAERLFQDATVQVAANALNLWGYINSVTVKYAEGRDLHGKVVSSAPRTFKNVVVEAGVAVNCCLNPRLHGQSPWDTAQIRYGAVQPPVLP